MWTRKLRLDVHAAVPLEPAHDGRRCRGRTVVMGVGRGAVVGVVRRASADHVLSVAHASICRRQHDLGDLGPAGNAVVMVVVVP